MPLYVNPKGVLMSDNQIYPGPSDPASPHTPVVYEEENITVEYKHIERDLQKKKPLSENELNKLGNENWELVAVFSHQSVVHYYLKRLKLYK